MLGLHCGELKKWKAHSCPPSLRTEARKTRYTFCQHSEMKNKDIWVLFLSSLVSKTPKHAISHPKAASSHCPLVWGCVKALSFPGRLSRCWDHHYSSSSRHPTPQPLQALLWLPTCSQFCDSQSLWRLRLRGPPSLGSVAPPSAVISPLPSVEDSTCSTYFNHP